MSYVCKLCLLNVYYHAVCDRDDKVVYQLTMSEPDATLTLAVCCLKCDGSKVEAAKKVCFGVKLSFGVENSYWWENRG